MAVNYKKLFHSAKLLLSDEGIILISIDDIEYANLKLLCDDIFSERNFMGTFIWKSRQVVDSRNRTHISNDHEYILAYSQNIDLASLLEKEVSKDKYSNPDNDPRGIWISNSILGLANAEQRPTLYYDLVEPATGIVILYLAHFYWNIQITQFISIYFH